MFYKEIDILAIFQMLLYFDFIKVNIAIMMTI